ncbi:NUDIX hydrolase [Opitutaceae bacterium TAV4]|nr:NUDIX hydrolase [Opitutaceae bacterium TAV4]RRK00840.1 NUDIX hydrolase [Opitutaceae bacterium TAV3]
MSTHPESHASSPTPPRWDRLDHRTVASTRVFDVQGVRFRHPRRNVEREFFVIDAPDWVNVLAVTTGGQIVLVNQFRYGTNDFSWEIPGGVIERGEDPVAAGMRELLEETGYAMAGEGEGGGGRAEARLLGSVRPNPAIMNNWCHFVLADGVRLLHPQAWDEDEELQVSTLPVDDVYAFARRGGITHSLVLDALMLFEPLWRARQGGGGRVS